MIRSAGGTRFAGDFFVVGDVESGRLDVSVVDVSGKGDRAGARALLLAGAMGGLVTALEPREFLPATNAYLINHPWQDGFATAVHLSITLGSGAFRVWTAGHPPALHWSAGAGRWTPLESEGPMLGLIPDADFHEAGGVLRPGDALMLYTDGMVETRHTDIGIGIDRLIGAADRQLRSKFAGGAKTLVESTGSRGDDRRAAPGLARLTRLIPPNRDRLAADSEASRRRCGTMTSRVTREGRPAPRAVRGRSSMVEPQSSKLMTRVRFPSSARRRSPVPRRGSLESPRGA